MIFIPPCYLVEKIAETIWGAGGFGETHASSLGEFWNVDYCIIAGTLKLTSYTQSLPHRCPVHRSTCLSISGAYAVLCAVIGVRERTWPHRY